MGRYYSVAVYRHQLPGEPLLSIAEKLPLWNRHALLIIKLLHLTYCLGDGEDEHLISRHTIEHRWPERGISDGTQ